MKTAIGILLALLTAGCTAARPGGLGMTPAASPVARSLPVVRGEEIAAVRCASCHSIDPVSESPRAPAPPFRDLRIRFNAVSWERKMQEIADGGHDRMPPLALPASDVADLRAFILSLR